VRRDVQHRHLTNSPKGAEICDGVSGAVHSISRSFQLKARIIMARPPNRQIHRAYHGWVRLRVGVVFVMLAIAVTTQACAGAGPADVRADVLAAAVSLRVSACRTLDERGTGLLVAPGKVLTSAHVVAGATSIMVIGAGATTLDADVIAFDPVNDLAIVEIPASFGQHVPLATDAPRGAFRGEVVLFRQDHPVVEPVEALRRVTINTEDIYRGADTSRPGYELRTTILPGDSGGVIVHDGQAVAVLWSRSRLSIDRAWAIDAVRGGGTIADQLSIGAIPDDIDVDRCA
jgi:hypothetical protein